MQASSRRTPVRRAPGRSHRHRARRAARDRIRREEVRGIRVGPQATAGSNFTPVVTATQWRCGARRSIISSARCVPVAEGKRIAPIEFRRRADRHARLRDSCFREIRQRIFRDLLSLCGWTLEDSMPPWLALCSAAIFRRVTGAFCSGGIIERVRHIRVYAALQARSLPRPLPCRWLSSMCGDDPARDHRVWMRANFRSRPRAGAECQRPVLQSADKSPRIMWWARSSPLPSDRL